MGPKPLLMGRVLGLCAQQLQGAYWSFSRALHRLLPVQNIMIYVTNIYLTQYLHIESSVMIGSCLLFPGPARAAVLGGRACRKKGPGRLLSVKRQNYETISVTKCLTSITRNGVGSNHGNCQLLLLCWSPIMQP
jgi:hypothetical protein